MYIRTQAAKRRHGGAREKPCATRGKVGYVHTTGLGGAPFARACIGAASSLFVSVTPVVLCARGPYSNGACLCVCLFVCASHASLHDNPQVDLLRKVTQYAAPYYEVK